MVALMEIDFPQYYLCKQIDNLYVNTFHKYEKKKRFVSSQKYFSNVKQTCKYTNKFHK